MASFVLVCSGPDLPPEGRVNGCPMLYTVTVTSRNPREPGACTKVIHTVAGWYNAQAIEDVCAQITGTTVDIKPDLLGYIKLKHPQLRAAKRSRL